MAMKDALTTSEMVGLVIDEADDSLVEHMMAKERELEESCMEDIDDDMIVEQFYLK